MRSLRASLSASSIFFSATLISALAACGSAGPAKDAPIATDAPPPDAPAEALFPAPLRLPEGVTPRAYDLSLRIDPAQPTFSGEVKIQVELARPTRLVRMHADGLTIASATAMAGGQRMVLEAKLDGSQLALVAPQALAAGMVELTLTWSGPLPEAPVGIYRVNDGGRWYVYTQFEPLEARRMYPSFDEPRFKTPYTTAIEVPAGLTAVSNNPERGAPQTTADGWTRYAFEPTQPLPTYLVALAVGDFDIVEGEKVSGGRVPFRVITTRGKGKLARFALEKTPKYLDMQERWFGIGYPFAKLDFLAVPSFSSSGMENAGLITYREAVLLIDGDKAAIEDRLWCESIIAHELAHMWFGDLVTMAWWDDLWLNEAFAVWMSRKSLQLISPELDIAEQALRSKFGVMHGDARANARAVRQPIMKDGDIYNAFDGITYAKGAAVLSMIEGWLGPERFREGVRSYLSAFAYGTATTADLMAHLQRDTGKDVASVVASFVDQPGVPLVSFDWRCEADGIVALELTQAPYKLLGDKRQGVKGTWRIPICARVSDGKKDYDHCGLIGDTQTTWRVNAGFCPTFAHPNVGEAGYYRWETRLGPISTARGDKAAFAGYVASLQGGVESGRLPLSKLLEGVEPLFEASVSPSELADLVGALGQVVRFDPEASDDVRFQNKARAWLDRIPLDLSLGDSARERRRQPTLVRALAGMTKDRRVLGHAAKVTNLFLNELEGKAPRGPSKLTAEDAAIFVPLYVAGLGHEPKLKKVRDALWQRLRAAFDKARDPGERDLVIEALASFDEPALVIKSYDLLLDGTLRSQDMRTLRAKTSGKKAMTDALWGWLTTNFDAIVEKLGAKAAPGLPGFAGAFCDLAEADKVSQFFGARKATLPDGIDRPLAQTLENIRACVVARNRYRAEAKAWYGAK